ncbi:DUF1345 domain-containing protein [Caenimonas terrae]|uniref:DUF1345 domain-containing protein n=1 Tax=Caenimonas terrae TaxID=696074 RepID=A0ABW0N9R8_9BURK
MSSFFLRLSHLGKHRPRLLAAGVWGTAVFLLLPSDWTLASRVLVAWNLAVWPYLGSLAWLMLPSSAERVREIAKQEDASSAGLMVVMSGAAVLSLVAIVAELAHGLKAGEGQWFVYGITLLTVLGSWLLLGALYTFHYAHMYYSAPQDTLPLRFPEGLQTPSYLDFTYFAFTIATAAQTSDVEVLTTPMRAAVIAQSVLSFFYNFAILGLSINIAAGLAGGK